MNMNNSVQEEYQADYDNTSSDFMSFPCDV